MNDLMVIGTELSIEEKIQKACSREEESKRERLERMADREREHKLEQAASSNVMMPHLFHANAKEYAKWLKGHLNDGGNITHVYDYNLGGIFVARSNFTVVPLYGASSISIVVPVGITVSAPHGYGHMNIYYIDGFATNANFVPLYNDVKNKLT